MLRSQQHLKLQHLIQTKLREDIGKSMGVYEVNSHALKDVAVDTPTY